MYFFLFFSVGWRRLAPYWRQVDRGIVRIGKWTKSSCRWIGIWIRDGNKLRMEEKRTKEEDKAEKTENREKKRRAEEQNRRRGDEETREVTHEDEAAG